MGADVVSPSPARLAGSLVRVATWNCSGHLAKKWAALDALAAELMIVQECGPDSPQLAQEHGWQAVWTGDGRKGSRSLCAAWLDP